MSEIRGHIYLVDDNTEIRTHLSALLQRFGYSVGTYASAEEYLERSLEVMPAVLVLDMRMPGLSGVQLQKRLIDSGRGTPIVFISGESRNDEIIEAFRSGAVEFLTKPFSVDTLIQAIEKGLQRDTEREMLMRKSHGVKHRLAALTPRERVFMARMINGHTNKEIAALEGVTADNIKKYRAIILGKMGSKSLAELIVMCRDAGLDPGTVPVDTA
jgi:FixJ family two-component response regulator